MASTIVDTDLLIRNWWVVLLRGIAGIVFGILTLFAPDMSLTALVLLFGAYVLADGILLLVSALRNRGGMTPRWALVLQGLAGVAAGVVSAFWPGISALALLALIAAWAVVGGVFEVVAAIRLRKAIEGEWLLALSGVASIAFGVLLALYPREGALAVVLWIGSYALVAGLLLTGLAFRLRSRGTARMRSGGFGAETPSQVAAR